MNYKQKGFALPISLLLLVVMTLMGATLVGITTSEVRDNDEKDKSQQTFYAAESGICLLYTSPSPRDKRQSRMPSSA